MKKARVLLGDDHALILRGIGGLLEKEYDLVGSVDNGQSALESALHLKPDVVVLDISMPLLNGIDATREITKALPKAKVILLTMHTNAAYLRQGLHAGASGYVLKSGAAEEILEAIRTVRTGNIYVSPLFGPDAIHHVQGSRRKADPSRVELTTRQRQILQLIAEGRHNKEIAEIVHVSVKTVEFHRGRLMQKVGAHGIADLIRFALDEGLVSSPLREPR